MEDCNESFVLVAKNLVSFLLISCFNIIYNVFFPLLLLFYIALVVTSLICKELPSKLLVSMKVTGSFVVQSRLFIKKNHGATRDFLILFVEQSFCYTWICFVHAQNTITSNHGLQIL